jgi:PAS domain S-box-containing protein
MKLFLTHHQTLSAVEKGRIELLEHENRQLRSILDLTPGSILVHDREGRILYANQFAKDIHGYTNEQFMRLKIPDLLPPDRAAEAPARIAAMFDDDQPVSFETMHLDKNGSSFPILVTVQAIQWYGQRALISVSTDLTRQKKAEDDYRADEARLESLLRVSQYKAADTAELLDMALHEALSLTGSSLGYIYKYDEEQRRFELNSWSKGVLEACSITEKKTTYDLDKTGIWGEAVRQRKPILLNDYNAQHPLKRGCPAGHAPLQRFLTVPVFFNNAIVAVVGVANKITPYDDADIRQLTLLMDHVWNYVEQKRTDDRIRENERRFRSMFENSPAALWEMDFSLLEKRFNELRAEGITDLGAYLDSSAETLAHMVARISVLNVNDSSALLLGANSHEEVVKDLSVYFSGESYNVLRGEIIALFNGSRELSFELPVVGLDGVPLQLAIKLTVVDGHESDLSRVIVSFIDLSAIKAAERAVGRLEKLESLGILAAGIAHDFNNLLNGIFGYIDLARATAEEKTKVHLDKAFNVFNRAKELSSELLTFSRGGAPSLKRIELGSLIKSGISAALHGTGTRTIFDIDDNLFECNADHNQLTQVFRNLALNAYEASPDSALLTVSAENCSVSENTARGSIVKRIIRITLRDNGPGIPQSELDHVLDPFFTTKSGHNGLGLTTAFSIIKRHHGRLVIESTPGSGTTVIIELPAAALK